MPVSGGKWPLIDRTRIGSRQRWEGWWIASDGKIYEAVSLAYNKAGEHGVVLHEGIWSSTAAEHVHKYQDRAERAENAIWMHIDFAQHLKRGNVAHDTMAWVFADMDKPMGELFSVWGARTFTGIREFILAGDSMMVAEPEKFEKPLAGTIGDW